MNKEDKNRRAETGPMAFGEDWPGIFIRGDNAVYYSMMLRQYLADPNSKSEFILQTLHGLADLLSGCKVTEDGDPPETQYVNDFNEVVVDKKK